MAFDSFKAQLSMLIDKMSNQPKDMHELYEMLHLHIMELQNLGQPVPQDLLETQKLMQQQMSAELPPKTSHKA